MKSRSRKTKGIAALSLILMVGMVIGAASFVSALEDTEEPAVTTEEFAGGPVQNEDGDYVCPVTGEECDGTGEGQGRIDGVGGGQRARRGGDTGGFGNGDGTQQRVRLRDGSCLITEEAPEA